MIVRILLLILASLVSLSAAAIRASGARDRSSPVVVVGTVVDAACYLMHPPAADGPTHDECGKACALAGVPLGVADSAGKRLYLADAAGHRRCAQHPGQKQRHRR
jgi:hypothetical protein